VRDHRYVGLRGGAGPPRRAAAAEYRATTRRGCGADEHGSRSCAPPASCTPSSSSPTSGRFMPSRIGHTGGRPRHDRGQRHPQTDATGRLRRHNGIVENYSELRHELVAAGVRLSSDTDTESSRSCSPRAGRARRARAARAPEAARPVRGGGGPPRRARPGGAFRQGPPLVVGWGRREPGGLRRHRAAPPDTARAVPLQRRCCVAPARLVTW